MSYDPETIAVYDANAAGYDDLVHTNDSDIFLETFVSQLPKGGHALDLGCGPASAAARMVELGLKVTAIDPSKEMAAIAKRKYGLDIITGTFDDVTQVDEFDGIWASFSLLHAPRRDMPRYLAAIHHALKSGGAFFLGMKTGTGEKRDGLGRKYTYYTETELTGLLTAAGFTVTDTQTGEGPGLDDVIAPWIVITTHA